MTTDDDRQRAVQERLAARLTAETGRTVTPEELAAIAAGTPWWLALEADASTRLDRDPDHGTHTLDTDALAAWAQTDEPTVDPTATITRGPDAGALPRWLHDDPDGYRIVDRD